MFSGQMPVRHLDAFCAFNDKPPSPASSLITGEAISSKYAHSPMIYTYRPVRDDAAYLGDGIYFDRRSSIIALSN